MKFSIVIPAYNEEDNIGRTIVDVHTAFPDAEIIVVNDASTDKTLNILESIKLKNFRILNNSQNMGHGYSVVRGMKAATGTHILYIDADRQIGLYNVFDIPHRDFYVYDVISGSRVNRQDKPFRKVISFCLRMTILFRFRYYIKDSNCPFKIYQTSTVQPLLNDLPESYVIPIACLEVLARKDDLWTTTVPVRHWPYQGNRKGFLQSFNPKMFKFLWSAFREIISL